MKEVEADYIPLVLEHPRGRELDPERYLADYLAYGYLAGPAKEKPIFRAIPYLVEQILAPVFTDEYIEREKGKPRIEMIGSIPRFMTGVVDRFWQWPRFFSQEAEKEGADSEAGEILEYLAHGPADIDFKILPHPQYRPRIEGEELVSGIGWQIIDRLGFDRDRIEKRTIKLKDGQSIRRYCTPLMEWRELDLSIDFGQIPTNPGREIVEIKFSDPKDNDRTVFLVHVAYLSFDAQQVLNDKRKGETTDKQDICTAQIESDGSNLYFTLSPEARELMQKPDVLASFRILEIKSAGDLLELGLRALRIGLTHPFNYSPAKIDKNWVFPLISTASKEGSIFDLRSAIEVAVKRGEEIPAEVRKVVLRELFLCLTIDPYTTILFLRDSGVVSLMPGLSNLNLEDWNKLLETPRLVLTTEVSGRESPPQAENYLEQQANAYWSQGLCCGVQMFIEALEERGVILKTKESPWLRLVKLFDRPEEEAVYEFYPWDAERERGRPIAVVKLPSLNRRVTISEEEELADLVPVDKELLMCELVTVLSRRRGAERPTRETEVRNYLERLIELRTLQDFIKKYGARVEFEMPVNRRLIEKMIGAMLEFPRGLTAREIARLCGLEGKSAFIQQLLILKVTGAVHKSSLYRINNKGEREETDFYCLRREPEERITLLTLDESTPGFRDEFYRLTGQSPTRFIKGFIRSTGITTLEALTSLARDDFELIGGVAYVAADANSAYKMARQIVQAAENSQQAEEQI